MYASGSGRRREECRRKEEEDGACSLAAGLPRRSRPGLHLHNRYTPATWSGMEAESSVSSVRYIARLVLARWQTLEISRDGERRSAGNRWKIRKETEKNEGSAGGGCGASLSLSLSLRLSALRTLRRRSRAGEETGEKSEKSVGAGTRRPMTSSELFASRESFSRGRSLAFSPSLSLFSYLSLRESSIFILPPSVRYIGLTRDPGSRKTGCWIER